MVNYIKPETRKWIEKPSTPSSKENGSIVISKDDIENYCRTVNIPCFGFP